MASLPVMEKVLLMSPSGLRMIHCHSIQLRLTLQRYLSFCHNLILASVQGGMTRDFDDFR